MPAGDKGEFGDSVATVMEGDGRRVFFSLWIESRTHTRNTGNGIGKDYLHLEQQQLFWTPRSLEDR